MLRKLDEIYCMERALLILCTLIDSLRGAQAVAKKKRAAGGDDEGRGAEKRARGATATLVHESLLEPLQHAMPVSLCESRS